MRIDGHQHFWMYEPSRHAWITDDMQAIRKDFLPEQLHPLLNEHQIDGCVTVQVDQTEAETEFLLQIAQHSPFVKGVVGWVDFRSPNIGDRLDYFSQFKLLKGFRHIVQGEPDEFLLTPEFCHGISKLHGHSYTYDILVYEQQLKSVVSFVKKFPHQPFIVDHLAKPKIKDGLLEPWKKYMKQLGQFENVTCKISGMVTEASWKNWRKEDIYPYLDTVLDAFGSQRLIYGSDWPVCTLAADYATQYELTNTYFQSLSSAEKRSIMGENAVRFYHL